MTIENTSQRDPLVHLLGAMSDGNGDYILGLEAAGQRQVVHGHQLPSEAQPNEQAYLDAGFTFGPSDDQDLMFRPAALPQGWRKEGSDHSMWSYIVDEHGRRRVSIFYKAAFYDRRAFMRLATPGDYLNEVLYNGGKPVLDDGWLTHDVATAELAAIRGRFLEEMEQDREYADRTGDSYWTGRIAEKQKQADRAELLRLSVDSGAL